LRDQLACKRQWCRSGGKITSFDVECNVIEFGIDLSVIGVFGVVAVTEDVAIRAIAGVTRGCKVEITVCVIR
jgi:hypothetical protein